MNNWQKKIYDSYQSSGHSKFIMNANEMISNYYISLIKKHVSDSKSVRILDLGCGNGSLIYNLKKLGYDNVVGVDTSIEQVNNAKKLGLNEVVNGSIDDFLSSTSERFDYIFMNDILEHIPQEDVIDLLSSVFNRINPGGKLILHVPNAEGINGMRVRYGDFTHIFSFTVSSITQVLRVAGFSEINCFEEKPTSIGLKGKIRSLLWSLMTVHRRALLYVESGKQQYILSQNLLAVAQRRS